MEETTPGMRITTKDASETVITGAAAAHAEPAALSEETKAAVAETVTVAPAAKAKGGN